MEERAAGWLLTCDCLSVLYIAFGNIITVTLRRTLFTTAAAICANNNVAAMSLPEKNCAIWSQWHYRFLYPMTSIVQVKPVK